MEAITMEAIVAELPNLGMEKLKILLKKITPLLYFDPKENFDPKEYPDVGLPSNAAALMTDGTIQVLEVTDSEDHWMCYEEGCAKLVKMKVKGIQDILELEFVQHSSKHTYTLYMSIKIGEAKYAHARGDFTSTHGKPIREDRILEQLHEALGIPHHQTAEMLYLLFYPYCDFGSLEGDIKPLAGRPPAPKRKRT